MATKKIKLKTHQAIEEQEEEQEEEDEEVDIEKLLQNHYIKAITYTEKWTSKTGCCDYINR